MTTVGGGEVYARSEWRCAFTAQPITNPIGNAAMPPKITPAMNASVCSLKRLPITPPATRMKVTNPNATYHGQYFMTYRSIPGSAKTALSSTEFLVRATEVTVLGLPD